MSLDSLLATCEAMAKQYRRESERAKLKCGSFFFGVDKRFALLGDSSRVASSRVESSRVESSRVTRRRHTKKMTKRKCRAAEPQGTLLLYSLGDEMYKWCRPEAIHEPFAVQLEETYSFPPGWGRKLKTFRQHLQAFNEKGFNGRAALQAALDWQARDEDAQQQTKLSSTESMSKRAPDPSRHSRCRKRFYYPLQKSSTGP